MLENFPAHAIIKRIGYQLTGFQTGRPPTEHIAPEDLTMPKFTPEMTMNTEFSFIHAKTRKKFPVFSFIPIQYAKSGTCARTNKLSKYYLSIDEAI